MLRFVCPLIAVEDMAASRRFYEGILGQKIRFDFGENVTFEGDFALHLRTHFQGLLGGEADFPYVRKAHGGEFYFETDDLDAIALRLLEAGVEMIHPVREQPWGQRVLRCYDPDGHVVEVGETIETLILRFHLQGLSVEEICRRSSLPSDFVERALREITAMDGTPSGDQEPCQDR